jgi:hypothetical protein
MMTLMLISLLFGAALGQRFKVLVLIPGMGIVLPTVIAAGIFRADQFGQIIYGAIAATVSLQIGYLAGIALYYLMVVSRASDLDTGSDSSRAPAR